MTKIGDGAMTELSYSISDEVFRRYPGYVRGVVLAVEDICRETIQLVKQFCGGHMHFEIISRQHPRITIASQLATNF